MLFKTVFYITAAAFFIWWFGRLFFCSNTLSGLIALPVLIGTFRGLYDVYNRQIKDAEIIYYQIKELESKIKLLENNSPKN